ncbi:uncharacterized protein AC631_03527 [Debaryomyces fabryi]|uniref:HTH CENPB-type domain-containing protein n=1 Tax=Debaryomyces fabryi TaxID=58627 RepID=A0A0V1PWP7_9ASCO|nr:uncharacterized protein AC631_03527 [Debaryomyces fabryi]KSA00708.1 hypothetical protein AC631_03527 [Debaryomyces fabryi]CUM52109.1 unnamed protein product [Debaryomyces fabryi]
MGYTIKQKIDICLKAESNPQMTQADLAIWAKQQYGSSKPPSQTTISRILCAKNDLIASKEVDFQLVRRRKQSNPILRRILTEWVTQAAWENIPITTPIIQLTANAIWNRLPTFEKDGNGLFNQKWCNHFIRKLNINLTGSEEDIRSNPGNHELNKVWKLDEKMGLKNYLVDLIKHENYMPQDIFTIDEFQLFYSLPLDQIFDVSSIDKGLKQSSSSTENSLTIMIGTNIDGSEKLSPLVVGKYDMFNVSTSSHPAFKNLSVYSSSRQNIMNKITEIFNVFYNSNINKWITSEMFQNYLLTLDHKLTSTSPNRKILILLDDSSSHRIINLKFRNIKLCYMKNNANCKNPYNSSYNGSSFNFLPTSFGIVEEFKILYRLQQYLEMIRLQRKNSKSNEDEVNDNTNISSGVNLNNYKPNVNPSAAMEVLSESDYHVPLIKVIEWIKRAWDSITQERTHMAWRKSHLINFKNPWPSLDPVTTKQASLSLQPLTLATINYDSSKSYDKLSEIMATLNVVIPWEINELLGLVNERGKITLSYVSIEEIVGSCLLEAYDSDESGKEKTKSNVIFNTDDSGENWFKESNISNKHITTTNIMGKQFSTPIVSSTNNNNNDNIITSNTNMFSGTEMQFPEYNNTNLSSMNINTLLADTSNVISEVQMNNNNSTTSQTNMQPQFSLASQGTVSNRTKESINTLSPISKFVATGDVSGVSDTNNSSVSRSSDSYQAEKANTSDHGHREKKRQLFPPNARNSISYMPQSFNERHNSNSPFLNASLSHASSVLMDTSGDNHISTDTTSNNSNKDELPQLLRRLLEMSQTVDLKLTKTTIEELSTKLNEIQSNDLT